MDTLTMQDIADLAYVSDPWSPSGAVATPSRTFHFPNPIAGTDLRFDAAQVAEWLRVTGRGNNPHAADDVMIHSSLLDAAADRLDDC